MLSFLNIFILSAIEGLTEFLPISSTGHLILVSKLLAISETDFVKTFEIAIQLGAIFAVVFLYWKTLLMKLDLLKKLLVAFIPTAIVGFVLYPFIKGVLLGSTSITLTALFLGGLVLIFSERFLKTKGANTTDLGSISNKNAFLIGAAQSISVIPGVSRAAATIIGGLFVGLNRETATEFSFLLAVPTMFAATFYDAYKSRALFTGQNLETIAIGFVLAFFFAMTAVKFLISYVKKNDFTAFGVYRIILAILFWIFIK